MILTSYGGVSCWLLPFAPNTDDAVKVDLSVPVDYQRSKAGLSTRRPQGNTLRIEMSWTCLMLASEFTLLRNATLQAQDEHIAVPFWPFAYEAGGSTRLPSTLTLGWSRGPSGWTTWAINPVLAYGAYAPLLWGRLKQPPRLTGRNGNHVSAELTFIEDGPFPVLPATAIDTLFAIPGGGSAPVWPWLWEGSTPPMPGAAIVETDRKNIGPGREQSTVFFAQMPERTQQASYCWKTASAAASLLGWWQRRAGGADALWIPTTQLVGQLATDAIAGAMQLQFTGSPSLSPSDTSLFLATPDGSIAYVKCSAPAGNLIPLSVPLSQSWPALGTTVAIAVLARHVDDKLSLEFHRAADDWIARAAIKWQEVAPEYTAPAGETLGATLGRLGTLAYFFQIDLDYAGAVQSWFLTNFDGAPLTANGQTWVYNNCDFDQIIQSDDLSDDGFTLSADWIDNGPWANWLPGSLAAVGHITISTGSVSSIGAVTNFTQLVSADLTGPKTDATRVEQKALGMNALFARQAPRQVYMPACSTFIFSSLRCTVAEAAWTFGATIVSTVEASFVLGTFTGTLPTGFAAIADWFALGTVRWSVGPLPMRAMILSSTTIAAGQVTVVVDRAIPLGAGAMISIVPGCNLLRDDPNGCAKFGNQINHQGFADTPAISPSFILPVRNANTQAKK